MSKVEVQVIYPPIGGEPSMVGVPWDVELEAAIEIALDKDVNGAGGWDQCKRGWYLSLNVNPARIPYIRHAIKSAFGDYVKVRV